VISAVEPSTDPPSLSVPIPTSHAPLTPPACPLCASTKVAPRWRGLTDRLFKTTARRFTLQQCAGCTTLFLWPVPTASELTGFYPEGYWVGPADGSRADRTRGLLAAYRRFVLKDHVAFVGRIAASQRGRGQSVRVLDIGCGDGSFLARLGEADAVGLDISASAVQATRGHGIAAVRGVPWESPLAPGTFSLVTSFHFLEHVPTPGPSLRAMRTLLRDDGDLVLQVPNGRSWQARLCGRSWGGYDVPRHLVNYSDRSLAKALHEHGFEVVAVNHFCLRDNPTTLANSLVPSLYPPARMAAGRRGDGVGALLANLAYLGVTVASMPWSFVESCCRRGASVMVHARKR
jgi:SAM-dependent methyltransferase